MLYEFWQVNIISYDLIYLKRDMILEEAVEIANSSTKDCGIDIEEIRFRRVFSHNPTLILYL